MINEILKGLESLSDRITEDKNNKMNELMEKYGSNITKINDEYIAYLIEQGY